MASSRVAQPCSTSPPRRPPAHPADASHVAQRPDPADSAGRHAPSRPSSSSDRGSASQPGVDEAALMLLEHTPIPPASKTCL
uniref:Predicted protein n=1 Tax=Hordeum vulgare subsp. vulgare TaxID=112509 RepID=F2D4M1_HORVV|nr:predicted protein [Hordeum vulgare subsp. vulgare]